MRSLLRAVLPSSLRRRIRAGIAFPRYACGLLNCYFYDMRRYFQAASKGHESVTAGKIHYTELRSWIAADTHKIEKGLSLRMPRPGFGEAVVHRLLENLDEYTKAFGVDWTVQIAVNVLTAYCRYNEQHDVRDSGVEVRLGAIAASSDILQEEGGVLKIERGSVLRQGAPPGIEAFFSSRYSIRDFSSEPVDIALVGRAVKMALKTPSVCNRQSWKAYVYLGESERERIFELQQGNRGFGELAGGVLIVTADLATFFSYGERNQAWIDGGMFAMSLVYGLHAVGLGSCCLNWSAEPSRDLDLRRLVGIPDNEAVIMLIAVGCLPEELNVAQSFRKPIEEVLIVGHLED